MIALAVSILWLAIGIIVVCGCIWLLIYAIKLFIGIPPRIEQLIWVVVLILCLIAGLTLLAGTCTFPSGTESSVDPLPAYPAKPPDICKNC